MADFPWVAEQRLGPQDAGTLARLAFGLPCRTIEELGEGWDFINYLADDKWVLRFPKRAECDPVLVRERQILESLHELSLPAAVPRFEYFSSSCDTFPWHFAGYPYLKGTSLSHLDDEAIVNAVAPQVGEFLAALHQKHQKQQEHQEHQEHQSHIEAEIPSPWDEVLDNSWANREFNQSIAAYPADLCTRLDAYLQNSRPAEPEVPRVLAHADLLEDHILVDPESAKLVGIIDWADACTRIRSADFAGLYYAGGHACAARAYATYEVEPDDDEWRWLQHTAIIIGIGEVHYGHHDNQPQRVARGLTRIDRYLP
jgi:Ser/Thr protein kinase RdoA (MazF antagonist)